MRRLLAVVVWVAAVAAACSGSSTRSPVRIGALYPLSGTQGAGGTDEERGVALAAEWANAHGGVNGRPIRLDAVDAFRPEGVPTALDTLRHQGVSIVLGSHGSSISAVAASLAGRENLSFWETGAVGEVGPGTVLSGLVRKIHRDAAVRHFGTPDDLAEVESLITRHV